MQSQRGGDRGAVLRSASLRLGGLALNRGAFNAETQRRGDAGGRPDPAPPTRRPALTKASTAAKRWRGDLLRSCRQDKFRLMSSKEIVLELVRRLPDEASMADIAREIEFVAGVREAMSEFDRGESITGEQLFKEIPKWAGTTK